MTGREEHAASRRSPDFPAEWGLPPGSQFSEERARWVLKNVRRWEANPARKLEKLQIRELNELRLNYVRELKRHGEILQEIADEIA